VSFSSFVSTLTASITRLSDLRKNEMRQFWLLRRYLKDKKVSRQLALRVQRYVEYNWNRQQKSVQERDVNLLMLLSAPLKEEVKAEALGPGVSVHPLFEVLQDSVRGFFNSLTVLDIAHGDLVFSYGEESREMYFVTSGVLLYERAKVVDLDEDGDLDDEGADALDGENLRRGGWACEPCLWTVWYHRGYLSATNDCTLIGAEAERFSIAVKACRLTWENVRQYAVAFVGLMNQAGAENFFDILPRDFSVQAALALDRQCSTGKIRSLPVGKRNSLFSAMSRGLGVGVSSSSTWSTYDLFRMWLTRRFNTWRDE